MSKNMKIGEIRVVGKSAYTLREVGRLEGPCGRCVFDKSACLLSKRLEKALGECSGNSYFDKPTIQEMIDWIMKESPKCEIQVTREKEYEIYFNSVSLQVYPATIEICIKHKNVYKAFEQLLVKIWFIQWYDKKGDKK